MTSIAYNPEKYGVTIVECFDAYEQNYDFHQVLVVKSIETGRLYAATDSGCSCPIPFEDHKFPSDFIEVRKWEDVKRLMDEHFPRDSYYSRLPHDSFRRVVNRALVA